MTLWDDLRKQAAESKQTEIWIKAEHKKHCRAYRADFRRLSRTACSVLDQIGKAHYGKTIGLFRRHRIFIVFSNKYNSLPPDPLPVGWKLTPPSERIDYAGFKYSWSVQAVGTGLS